jgi:hypothetical protein
MRGASSSLLKNFEIEAFHLFLAGRSVLHLTGYCGVDGAKGLLTP